MNANALKRAEPFTYKGIVYTIARASFNTRTMFAEYLAGKAMAFIRRQRGEMTDADFRQAIRGISDGLLAGEYDFGTDTGFASLRTDDDKFTYMMYLTLIQHHPKLTIPEVAKMVEEHGAELFDIFLRVNSNPPTPPAGTDDPDQAASQSASPPSVESSSAPPSA